MANVVPVKTARETVNILQNHYHERLATAFLFNPPKVFQAFWKVVKYFFYLRTIDKVKSYLGENMPPILILKMLISKNQSKVTKHHSRVIHKYIDPEVLPIEFGGKSSVVYNYETLS
ncbi:hypothetical protein Zm00014a_004277 [Zea mays]|uniref:CRAL-TRIO domain-containing protein n=1 Tax=Zea mays TaxID=4577 RepID=A0A3L6EPD9_MAIZE|nr:hypothetical protein Zm00014a_004277 [Zea mays]